MNSLFKAPFGGSSSSFIYLTLAVFLDNTPLFSTSLTLMTAPLLIFYWSIHRPEYLSVFSIFCVGFLDDVLGGSLLGKSPLLLLIFYAFMIFQGPRLKEQSFRTIWATFSLSLFIFSLTEWALECLIHQALLSPHIYMLNAGLWSALYPWLNRILQTLLKHEEEA